MFSRDAFFALIVLMLFSLACRGLIYREPVPAYNFYNLLTLQEVIQPLPGEFDFR